MELVVGLVIAVVVGAIAAVRARRGAGRQRELMLLCRHAGLEFQPLDPFSDTMWLPFRLYARGEALVSTMLRISPAAAISRRSPSTTRSSTLPSWGSSCTTCPTRASRCTSARAC